MARIFLKEQLSKVLSELTFTERHLEEILPILGNHVMSYIPSFSGEIDISLLNEYLLKHRNVYVPQNQSDGLHVKKVVTLKPYHLDDHNTNNPFASKNASIYDIDTIILPCVGVDLTFHRLGRGKAHYDQFLKNVGQQVKKIVIIHKSQILDNLQIDPWDQPVDHIFVI